LSITFDIAVEFALPEFDARLGCARFPAAGMTMPKASMYEDDDTMLGKYEVWCSRKVPSMKAVAEAKSMGGAPDSHLSQSIFGAHPRHQPRASLSGEAIQDESLGCDRKGNSVLELRTNNPENSLRNDRGNAISDHSE
jgi:hypothetical protein